jgi:hypothetical protein
LRRSKILRVKQFSWLFNGFELSSGPAATGWHGLLPLRLPCCLRSGSVDLACGEGWKPDYPNRCASNVATTSARPLPGMRHNSTEKDLIIQTASAPPAVVCRVAVAACRRGMLGRSLGAESGGVRSGEGMKHVLLCRRVPVCKTLNGTSRHK